MLRPLRLAVAEPDRMDGRDVAWRTLGEEAALERGEQRLRHRVTAARPADQQRVAGPDHADGFIGGDASQGRPPSEAAIVPTSGVCATGKFGR
jgi:hypothetical protein